MENNNLKSIRWSGIAGTIGGFLLYVGDMLNYFSAHNPVPGGTFTDAILATLAQVEPWRLITSGALGVICAWLYTLGAWQVYQALLPAGRRLAIITAGAFAALMIYMGQFHTAVVPYALGAKVTSPAEARLPASRPLRSSRRNKQSKLPRTHWRMVTTMRTSPPTRATWMTASKRC
jgi:hypothetical protein